MSARSIRVRGVVQGVGFRPYVFRLAHANTLAGWVRNGEEGVEIHLEGADAALDAFLRDLETQSPPAARITAIEVGPADPAGLTRFTIRESRREGSPTVRISPDLPVCGECLKELFTPGDRRFQYPYINCTNCGPRYTIVLSLPYDRPRTTMKDWPLDPPCDAQYHDPADRRFHAQPVACAECGPHYYLRVGEQRIEGDIDAIRATVHLLKNGGIVAIKGLGGYHLACDARNTAAVHDLRERKFRKEKPFAVMTRDAAEARRLAEVSSEAEALLESVARPIVLCPKTIGLDEVAPDNDDVGIMLPYTPMHHLLFAEGAPAALVMTSANRSNEPIAYEDEDAVERLGPRPRSPQAEAPQHRDDKAPPSRDREGAEQRAERATNPHPSSPIPHPPFSNSYQPVEPGGIADAFLIGERPIARRMDDSVVRVGRYGPAVLRRARGYAPEAVSRLPIDRPILAVGADLKNSVTLVVDGQAFVSQHIGDLDHYEAFQSFGQTIRDLAAMYDVPWDRLMVVHDCHPQYASTAHALGLAAAEHRPVQHHRAHIASVLAEREAWHERVIGVSLDGTGYGDDGTIWGGEIFVGSVAEGFERAAHLRTALLPGGDAAARFPVQAAAGFLAGLDGLPDLTAPPFDFPDRYRISGQLVRKAVRTFPTTSIGRLFDTAAALAGFTRPISFEGQAAMWLEHLARRAGRDSGAYAFPIEGDELDYRPLLRGMIEDRLRAEDPGVMARRFHRGLAIGLRDAVRSIAASSTVVLSGGVFQNELLLGLLGSMLEEDGLAVWTNHAVPANDGGISLGQAALAACGRFDKVYA